MKLGIIMDPIGEINIKKDSSFAMLLAAQAKNWQLYYIEINDLFLLNNVTHTHTRRLAVQDNISDWFQFYDSQTIPLANLDVILMRKDPPVDMAYIYATHLLELTQDTLIVNHPAALRDANEKLFISWFPDCIAPTLVSGQADHILSFLDQHKDIILKPVDGMGGMGIFHIRQGDQNTNVAIEILTNNGKRCIVAQKFIPEITAGDKRILIIDGKPCPYALARIPQQGQIRGNLAAGGSGKSVILSTQDRRICDRLAPILREKGLMFVGIDVIGEYLTEINVTSPTCIRELDKLCDLNIADQLLRAIENKLV